MKLVLTVEKNEASLSWKPRYEFSINRSNRGPYVVLELGYRSYWTAFDLVRPSDWNEFGYEKDWYDGEHHCIWLGPFGIGFSR